MHLIQFILYLLGSQEYGTGTYTAKKKCRKFETHIPRKELRGHSPNFHIHVSVSDSYIPTIDLPILLQENMGTEPSDT